MAKAVVKTSTLSGAEEAVLCDILKVTKAGLLAHVGAELTLGQLQKFVHAKAQLKRGFPLAYVLGYRWFCGLKFKVNEHVLVPRPETEQLVDLAIVAARAQKLSAIVDVGTGSGAVAVSLKRALGAKLKCTALDISPEALKVARANARANKVKVQFKRSDLLASTKVPKARVLITANLPYLTRLEMSEASIQYEPKLALLGGGSDGTGLTKKLISQVGKMNLENSVVLLEIGYAQAETLTAEAATRIHGCKVRVHKDAAGFDRVLEVRIA